MAPRILSISYDQALLATRRLLLETAGYEVTSAIGFAEALEVSDSHFDLIIMGHSIPQKDKRAIISELRKHGCHSPVLSLLRFGERSIPEAADGVDPYDPERMLEKVKALLDKEKALRA